MNAHEFKTIYEELMYDWELEGASTDIAPLPESKLKKFLKFQKEIHQIEHHAPPADADTEAKSILFELKKESSKNVDFLIYDLLALRQEKIIEMSKRLDVIDQNLLTLSEQEFYRNLLSAFKGYKKTKQYFSAVSESCEEAVPEEECETDPLVSNNKIEFCDVRVLKDAEALVGPNLITYGPFHKEDIVRIPKQSARIMVKEKVFEILE